MTVPTTERATLKYIWQTLKDYFGDGYVVGSAPFSYKVHLCETQRAAENGNIHYGININEEAMALFGSLGQAIKPPCTCQDMAALIRHIDDFVETASEDVPDAYEVTSRKSEKTAEETILYSMRDAMQWWVQWHGSIDRENYWKHLYICFGTACDDIFIPPQHLINGQFRFLGHTAADVLAGLRSEGVSADDCLYMEMNVWRQYFAQYIEKAMPTLRSLLVQRTCVMSQFRVMTANTHGCACALLTARGISLHGERLNAAVEMASYGDALSMDMAKEALGLLQGEPTEATAGRNRALLTAELRWMYARAMEQLDLDDGLAPYLRRYASAGLHYVLLNDRYQERLKHGYQRLSLTPAMDALIKSYTVGLSIPLNVHEGQLKSSVFTVPIVEKDGQTEEVLTLTEVY